MPTTPTIGTREVEAVPAKVESWSSEVTFGGLREMSKLVGKYASGHTLERARCERLG
jgi:hypothetical protein